MGLFSGVTKVLSNIGGAIAKPLGWASGFLGPVGPFLGTAVSALQNRQARKSAKSQFQSGTIGSIVDQAKAAGIHPLAALGHQNQPVVPGQSDLGSSVADGVRSIQTKDLRLAQLRAANASAGRDEAEAALLNSQAKRTQQAVNSQPTSLEPVPLHRTVIMPDGSKRQIVNNQVAETEVPGTVQAVIDEFERWKKHTKKQRDIRHEKRGVNIKNLKGLFRGPRKFKGSSYWRKHGGE